MTGIGAAFWAESLKIRKSRMLLLSLVAAVYVAGSMGFLTFVSENPELVAKMGIRPSAVNGADWPSYLGLLTQMVPVAGLLGSGFIASWVFGREYTHRTVKDLLALPVARSSIVLAKFLAIGAWSALLAFVILAFALAIGGLIGLTGWSDGVVQDGVYAYMATALMTILLCTPVAFFASYGRGYLPPLGFMVLSLIMAQFIGVLSLGQYFPWAIPSLYAGAGGPQPGPVSYILLAVTCLAGLAATFGWWRYADQT